MEGDPPGGAQLINWSHHTLTLNICYGMIQADTANQKERYFKNACWFLYMLVAYLTEAERRLLEADFVLLEQAIAETKQAYKENDVACQNKLLELKENFADTHRALGFAAFSRSGIVYPTDDGEIDFDKLSLDKVRAIVQAPFGKDKGLERVIMKEMKTDGQ